MHSQKKNNTENCKGKVGRRSVNCSQSGAGFSAILAHRGCRPLVYFSGSHRNALGDAQGLNIDHLTSQVFICFGYRLNFLSKNTKRGSYITKSNT